MSIVEFDHRVKYRGAFYAPHTSIEVDDKDLDELTAIGAKVLSRNAQDTEKASKPQAKTSTAKKPYKIPPPSKEK